MRDGVWELTPRCGATGKCCQLQPVSWQITGFGVKKGDFCVNSVTPVDAIFVSGQNAERRIWCDRALPHAVFAQGANQCTSAMQRGPYYIGPGGAIARRNYADLQVSDQTRDRRIFVAFAGDRGDYKLTHPITTFILI